MKDEQLWPGKHISVDELRIKLAEAADRKSESTEVVKRKAGSWGIQPANYKLSLRERLANTTIVDDVADRWHGEKKPPAPARHVPETKFYGHPTPHQGPVPTMRERTTKRYK